MYHTDMLSSFGVYGDIYFQILKDIWIYRLSRPLCEEHLHINHAHLFVQFIYIAVLEIEPYVC